MKIDALFDSRNEKTSEMDTLRTMQVLPKTASRR